MLAIFHLIGFLVDGPLYCNQQPDSKRDLATPFAYHSAPIIPPAASIPNPNIDPNVGHQLLPLASVTLLNFSLAFFILSWASLIFSSAAFLSASVVALFLSS